MSKITIYLYTVLCLYICGCAPSRFHPFDGKEDIGQFQPEVFVRLDASLRREALSGAVPAAAVALWMDGDIVYTNCYGALVPDDPRSGPVTTSSFFDLASLTKPIAGYPLARGILEEKRAEASFVPAILDHSTGCDDEVAMPRLLEQRSARALADTVREMLGEPSGMPSGGYRYSNAAYASIGAWNGREVGAATTWLRKNYWIEAKSGFLTYRPDRERCVASGIRADDEWIRGTPFDPLADLMLRGFSLPPTHSGLFGTAEDVARFGGYLTRRPDALSGLIDKPRLRHDLATGQDIWVTSGGLRSAIDLPYAPPGTTPGRILYQTGYTGCLLWIDLDRHCAVAILSNASASDAQGSFDALSARIIATVLQGYTR